MRARKPKNESDNPPDQGDATPASVGEVVRARRGELGMTLARLAELAGCTKGYLSEIENGRREKVPGAALLAQLEAALELEEGRLAEAAAWQAAPPGMRKRLAAAAGGAAGGAGLGGILGWERRMALLLAGPAREGGGRSLDSLYRSGVLRALAEHVNPEGGVAGDAEGVAGENVAAAVGWGGGGSGGGGMGGARGRVPIINSVAAGYPADFTDLGYPARVADDYLAGPGVGGTEGAGGVSDPDAFAARVVGDSMEPEYREGDIVVFSPARGVCSGDDCFARLEPRHESTFKRVYFEKGADGAELIRLAPLNGKYPARVVAREEVAGLYAAVSVTRAVLGGGGGRGKG